jgi:signal transduction histidine kinase
MKRSFSIRSYLFLSNALLLATSLGAIGFIWSRNEYQVLTQELQNQVVQRADQISNIVGHEIAEHGMAIFERTEFPQVHLEENMRAVYIDSSDALYELRQGSVNPREADVFLQLSSEYYVRDDGFTTLVKSGLDSTNVYAAAPVLGLQDQRIGTVCLLLPIGYLDSYIARLRWLLMGALLFVILLGAGGSTLLTNYFSRHFSRAQGLAATVADGDYQLRIPEDGPTELRDLSRYLNQMAEKLHEQLKMRRTLLANVAHELARPLAGLQLGIESLRKGAIQDLNLADDLLVSMGQTIRRLEGLVDDITLAAQPETRPIELHCSALAVGPFLQGIATRFWTLSESRGTRLEVQVEADLPSVYADEKRLNQIVGNLMDNAIKFSKHGSVIHLSAECADGGYVRMMVHDGGSGISPKEAERLFEPFYQGNVGRRIKQGMGLGLAIAHQLAQAHGGNLELKNHPDGGGLAILTLPIANS